MAYEGALIEQYGKLIKYPDSVITEEISKPLTRYFDILCYYIYKDKKTDKYIMYLNNAKFYTRWDAYIEHKQGYDYSEETYPHGTPDIGDGSFKKYTSSDGVFWKYKGDGYVYTKEAEKVIIKLDYEGEIMSPQPVLITKPVFKFEKKEE